MFFGFFLYKKKVTASNVLISSVFNTVFINLGLTTLWLSMMYGDAFIVLIGTRLVKNVIEFPVYASLLFMVLKLTEKLRERFKY